jgi:hypothetical protein
MTAAQGSARHAVEQLVLLHLLAVQPHQPLDFDQQ